MIFNFSSLDDESCSANPYSYNIEKDLKSLENKIHEKEEDLSKQQSRLLVCIHRREWVANAATILCLLNALLLPCLKYFDHPIAEVYSLALINLFFVLLVFWNKKGWEKKDFEYRYRS